MKQLNTLENSLFRIGAVLMIVGLLVRLHNDMACLIIYGIGCALYALMQLRQEYLGTDFILKRLRRQQLISCVVLLASVLCMSMQTFRYGMFQRNEWLVCLAIATVIQLYTAWRIPAELSKHK